MWASLTKHWFLTALAVCFATGYLASDRIQPLLEMVWLRGGVVFFVMWVMGVTLQAETVRRSIRRPLPSLLAIGFNVAVVPLLCLPTMWLLPPSLFGGLFVTSIVPCTLAGASVWTRKAGGDDSVAIMTTVVTNLACVAVVPLGIWLVLSRQAEIDASGQVGKLALIVVAPLLLAQLMRRGGLSGWADRNKPRLSFIAQLGILVMVVFGATASASKVHQAGGGAAETSWGSGLVLVVSAMTIHLTALYLGVMAARCLGISRGRQIAVGVAGSQKTLMVGLQIAIDCGVSVIPMLVYHLGQLSLDTLVADRWKSREPK